jgi:hypothetical protein
VDVLIVRRLRSAQNDARQESKKSAQGRLFEEILVGGAGFEPATPWMSTKYSNQLN